MEVQKLLLAPTLQVAHTPLSHGDPFYSYRRSDSAPRFMTCPEQSRLPLMDRDGGWERLQFNRMRAQVDDQEATLREKEVQLAMVYHELQEERLRHGATRQALERGYEVVRRSMDASEVLKALSELGSAVEQLKRQQQEMLLHYPPSGGFTSILFEECPLCA